MEPRQQSPTPHTKVEISLAKATIRSCSLDRGKLDVTLTNNLQLKFSPTQRGVRRYLHVVEYGPLGFMPDDFVARIQKLLRMGYLGVPKLIDPKK